MADEVDVSPDVVWILAVGSDARPGEDMTRTRGDALQLVGDEHQDRRRHGDRRTRATPGSTSPATATTRSTPPSTSAARELLGETVGNLVGDPARLRLRHPVRVSSRTMIDDDRRDRRRQPRSPSPTTSSSPRASRQGRIHLGAVRRAGVLPDPARPDPRRLRPLGQPAAGAARHPGQGPGAAPTSPASSSSGVLSRRCSTCATDLSPAELFRLGAGRGRTSTRPRSPTASSRAASATSAVPAWSCRTSTRRAGSATTRAKDATIEHC